MATLTSEVDGNSYRANRCHSCGALSADPIPETTLDYLRNLYGSEYTDEMRTVEQSSSSAALLRTATHRQMEIVERYVRPGRALNVGAMNQAIQALPERGWKLKLIDVSEHAALTARRMWGFDVTVSRLEDFDSDTGSFDFVKLGHVVEHLSDPSIALRNVARLLRPGGIVLIDTDNSEGLRTQIEGTVRAVLGESLAGKLVRRTTGKDLAKRYGRLIPPIHLHIFSERALRHLLTENGFEVLEVRQPAWGDRTWFPLPDASQMSLAERLLVKLDQTGALIGRGELLSVLARRL